VSEVEICTKKNIHVVSSAIKIYILKNIAISTPEKTNHQHIKLPAGYAAINKHHHVFQRKIRAAVIVRKINSIIFVKVIFYYSVIII